jgi:hypothetical protein
MDERVEAGSLTAPITDATRSCCSVFGRNNEMVVDWAALNPTRASARNSCDCMLRLVERGGAKTRVDKERL